MDDAIGERRGTGLRCPQVLPIACGLRTGTGGRRQEYIEFDVATGGRLSTTGNVGLDALADAIADRVYARLEAAEKHNNGRLLNVPAAAQYLCRSPSAIRHMIAKGALPAVRRDGRVYLDRQDLDTWVELGKTRA